MFEGESGWSAEANEQFPESGLPASARGGESSCNALRRIERLRELRCLRELLNDPEFEDFE